MSETVAPAGSPLTPEQVAGLLDVSATAVRRELEALGDAEAAWHPAPGEWCVKEVVGHLIEAERRGFAGRIRTLLAEAHPAFAAWDPPAVAAARRDCEQPPGELAAEFRQLREDSLALVRALRPADLTRSGTHARVGVLTVQDVLQEWVHHDRNHLRQALANAQARVWPHMGNARRFSLPQE